MAYKQSVIETARQFYVLEGKTVEQISTALGIPLKTCYNWVRRFEWDKDIRSGSNVGLYLEMQRQFQAAIQLAIEQDRFADASTADALWKTAKIMEKMAPQKMMLSNIFNFLEDLTTYFVAKIDDAEFMERYQAVLPELGDWLRKKYTNE
jgi:transposase-like protein